VFEMTLAPVGGAVKMMCSWPEKLKLGSESGVASLDVLGVRS